MNGYEEIAHSRLDWSICRCHMIEVIVPLTKDNGYSISSKYCVGHPGPIHIGRIIIHNTDSGMYRRRLDLAAGRARH